jgi:hypothetical protein
MVYGDHSGLELLFLIGKSQMAPVGWAARLAALLAMRFIPDEMN